MSKIKGFATALIVSALSFFGSADAVATTINEQAAALQPGDWLVTPMTGSPSDIVNIGTLAEYKDTWGTGKMTYANYVCTGDESVNGVPLGEGYGSNHEDRGINGLPGDKKTDYGTCGLDATSEYANILSSGRELWTATGVQTFTLSGLKTGKNYLVQVIIHNEKRPGSTATAGGQTMHYGSADSSGEWYYGGTLIHVFTATSDTYSFDIDFEADAGSTAIKQINAVQVRLMPELTIEERAADLAAAFIAGTSSEQWLGLPMTGSPDDIVTTGTVVIAQAFSKGGVTTDATVKSIAFSSSQDGVATDTAVATRDDGFGYADCDTSTAYGKMLDQAWKSGSTGHTVAYTLSGLESGHTYIMQMVIHHGSRTGNEVSAGGKTICYSSNSSGDWFYGGSFIHVFTATATTYTFNVVYTQQDMYNMLQVRDVTPVRTIAEQAEALQPGEWMAAPLTGDPSDVLTLGEPVTYTVGNVVYTNAYAAGADTGVLSLGGVDFVRGDSYKNVYGGGGVYGGHQQGDCGVAAPYGSMLNELYFKDATTITFTIGPDNGYPALVTGEDYLVQLFIHSALWEDTATVANTDKSVRFCAQNSGDDWYYGGTFVHKFTATGSSYSFTINYSNSRAIYNAVLVRKLPKSLEPVAPSFTLGAPTVDGTAATITLTDVVKGTDSTGETDATTYRVFAYEGDDPTAADEVASDQPGATASFQVSGLAAGTHAYHVYIVNDQGATSVTNTVSFKIVQSIDDQAKALQAGDWLAAPMTGSPSDIVTRGQPAKTGDNPIAYAQTGSNSYTTDATVNGVSFANTRESLTLTPNHGIYGQDNMTNCGLDTYYGNNILAHYWKGNISGNDGATTFSVTVPSAGTYLMQLVVHHTSTDKVYLTEDADVAIYGGKDKSAGDDWYYGGTFVHVFTMDAAGTYQFSLQYSGEVVFNMFQLRDITPPPSIAEQAEALQPGEWLAAPLTGDPSDVLTLGEPVTYTAFNETYTNAYAKGASWMTEADHASVNGIAFNDGSYKNLTISSNATLWPDEHGNCGMTGDYAKLLDSLWWIQDVNTVTYTIGGNSYPALEVGADYVIQLFFHSAFSNQSGSWTTHTVTADTDKTVQFGAASAGDDWYYGGTLVHKFTAANTSYSFTLNYSGQAIYNAFQIRKLAAEPTPVYTLTIPAHDHLSVASVTTNSVPVEGVAGAYSIVSNTEVSITFAAESGWEITSGNPVVLTVEADTVLAYGQFPAVQQAAVTPGWTAVPMDANGQSFSTDGTLVFSFSRDRGDPHMTYLNESCSVPFNYINLLTDTVTQWHPNQHGGAAINGPYNDGRQPSDFITTTPVFNGADDKCGDEGQGGNMATFGSMLQVAWEGPNLSTYDNQATYTLHNLEPGYQYLVEFFIHCSGENKTITAPDGVATVYYGDPNTSDDDTTWRYGGILRGIFNANSGTQDIVLTYSDPGSFRMNAIQLRKLGPVPPPESPYTVTGDPETIIDGDYIVYVWTNAAQTGTLTIPSNVSADYLLVGGGGAGGFCRGGGGGGGGVVYGEAQTLAAGTYTITVGAGGTPDAWTPTGSNDPYKNSGSSTAGTDGGTSALTIATVPVCEAFGGGGGGTFITGQNSEFAVYGSSGAGRTGANAGGSANKAGSTAASVASGFAGGAAWSGGDAASGGGGGAAANGVSASANDVSGNGGVGVECSITGEPVVYGGGGGAGVYSGTAGVGGLGGGGNGGKGDSNSNTGMTAGVDGLGGGGGGAAGGGNVWAACGGAPGGSGTVIIRLPLDPSSQAIRPAFVLATPAVSGTSATITLNNVVIGTDESGATQATAYDVFTYTGSDPTAATKVAEDADENTANFTLTDVAYGDQTYYVYIVNDQNVTSETATVSFTIVDTRPLEERVPDMRDGDWLGMPLTGEAADVLTNGMLITVNDDKGNPYQFSYGRTGYAYYTTDSTVNDVPAVEDKIGWGVTGGGFWSGSGGDGAGDCGTTGQYALYMSKFFKCSRSNTDVTISCTVPAAGTYLVQMFVHYQSDSYLNQYVSVVGNSDVKIPYTAASGTPGYYGGTLVHVFEMAAAGTYEFTLHYDKEAIVNYIQVRDVSAMIPQEPRLPSITAANVLVEGDCAQVTITGVDMGTDEHGYLATSYGVYASVDDATATLVAADQSEATAMFLLSGLSQGEHDVDVYIVNDKGGTSEELSVEVTIVSAPAYFFPDGNWEALQLSKEATEIRTFGETVCALACSAGNNGRLYTVNGLKYHDTQRNDASWGDWQLVNWADFEPALNSDKDSFGGEDVPTISNEDMAFQTVCKRGWLSENGSRMTTDFTMTLKQLEPGARYVVQLTAHNGSDNYGGPSQTMTAPDGVSTITLGDANTSDADTSCRYGGTLIGTFVASNTTHAFRFTYGPDSRYYQVNSLQLRKLGAAPAVVPDYPTLGGTSVAVSRGNATLTVSGLDAGVTDGACDIYYAIAEEGQAFGSYTLGAQNVTGASASFALGNTEEGKSYVYSVYAVNPATKLASLKTSGKFRIDANPGIPEAMTIGPVIRPGLVQAKFASGVLFNSGVQPPLVSNLLTQTTHASSLDYTYGALMAHQSCADENAKVLNPYSASQWNWDANYSVFAYEGEIYLREGQRLVIFGCFDDGEAAVVDGVTLLAQGNATGYNNDPATRWVVYEPAESGWYPINAWVWDWTSGKNVMIPPSALAYNLAGLTSNTDQNRDQWKPLEDTDGKGSFLRFKEAKTLMTLGVPTTNGVDVTINAAFDDLPFPAKFVVYANGSQDGGLDPANWENIFEIANIASGDTAAANYTVKGLAAYPFVRFAIVAENSISTAERCQNFYQMSCVVGFDSDGLAVLIADPSFTTSEGTFNIVVAAMGGATSVDFAYQIAADPLFANVIKTGSLDGITAAGTYGVNVTDLTEAGTYYIRVKPTADGVGGDWIEANPVTPRIVGTLRINEIMASNGSILKTKNGGEDLDWIEIYNGTDEEVDLAGWYLSDNFEKGQSKWKVIEGNGTIPVHGYKIIWCDKDYTNWAADEAHTAIGLSTSGETVFLAKPDGTVVDTVTFGTQMKEISYGVGKMPGASETSMVFFSVPTPGAENGEIGAGPMTPSVTFSVPHGYKTAPIDVTITCADDPAAAIYYTLDGTQPTASNGTRYTEPLHITSTTILRAGVPQENSVLQVDSSATYIYLDDVLAQGRMGDGAASETARLQTPSEKFPVTGTLPTGQANKHAMRYGMIQSIVNGPDRERILRGFTNTVATLSIVMDPELLFGDEDGIYVNSRKYMANGAAGERPMLLEQIDPVNGAVNEFSVPGGLRLRGAGSLTESNPKHALRFFFRGKYGMAKLNFPLFGDEGADEFSKVDLRCSQNYSWSMENSDYETFIHEVFSRDSQRDLGQPYTRSRYYNLFINGHYWGLYQTQERGDDDFAETYLGGSAEQYDCIKTSSIDAYHYYTQASSGTDAAWKALQGLAYNGFSGDYVGNYNQALGLNADGTRNPEYPILLNPENLMAYVTISHFVCDADGPVSCGNGGLNNLYANRYRIDGASDMDGFWFLRHDAEYTLGVTNSNDAIFSPHTQYWSDPTALGTVGTDLIDSQGHAVDGQRYRGEDPAERGENRSYGDFGPYQLHWELAKNPVYKRAFADYFYKNYLKEGGAMTVPVAKRRFEARMAEIDDVVVSEAARWSRSESQPMSREKWLAACQSCLDFIENRIPVMKAQYQARGWYPMLDAPLAFVDGVETDGLLRRKGETVTFSVTNDTTATIIYTIDGTDPADSANAITNATLVLGDLPVTVLVRAVKDDEVSALTEITFRADDGYTFYFNGAYTDDQTINPTGKECVVVFEDAEIAGRLVLPDGVKAYLCPTNGTANTVAGIVGEGAHLTLKDFDGQNGRVSLTGADTLIAISNLVVKSGTLDLASTGVTETKTPVVKVLGHVKQDGGTIKLDTRAVSADPAKQVYGIFLANKDPKDAAGEKMKIIYAEFNGGTFNATVGGWKSAALYVDKGSVEATFNEGSTNIVSLVGPEARFVNASGDLNLKGGEFTVTMPETYTSLTNARVFKSDKEIKIKGGHYVVNVPGPGSEIFSVSKNKDLDDSIITITDGTFELVSDDDCFNADDRIEVKGGLFHAVSLNNDVFDSNGDMIISGGTIMAYATAEGHEAFDVDPMVQGEEVSLLPHQLTISGGTIFATGGKNSAWPENLTTGTGVTLLNVEDGDVSAYSDKYLTLPGIAVDTTALLPTFPKTDGSILATCLGLNTDNITKSASAPTEGSQDFHELYIVPIPGMDQTGLRFLEIYGSTTGDGNTGEYIVLTNVSDQTINLAGVKVNVEKLDDYNESGIGASKCCFTLTGGTLAAGEAIRLDQATYWSGSKKKITNGDLHIEIFDATGATVQVGETSFSLYAPETDGGGASLIAKRFDNETPMTKTTADWASSYPSVGSVDAVVTEQSVTITLSDVSIGKDASSYDVYLVIDGAAAQKVGEGVTETTFEYTMNDLEPGNHSYSVYIENDQNVRTQATEEKSFTVEAPEADIFPEGLWEAKSLTRTAAEIVTDGEQVWALASSAGNNGQVYTVNGVAYYDSKSDDAAWGDYNLAAHVDLSPALNASADDFGSEDAPGGNPDMGFNTVCKRAWYNSENSRTSPELTMTLKGLEQGAKYVVQLTVHNNSNNSDRHHPDETMTAPDGIATIQYGPLTSDDTDPNRYGGTLIGTFVASNTTHAFTFTNSDPTFCQLNSIQLRMLEEAPTEKVDYPKVEEVTATVSRGAVTIDLEGIDSGVDGGAYALYYAIVEEGTPLEDYEYALAAKDLTGDSYKLTIDDLPSDKSYVYSVYVANGSHLASSKATGTFRIDTNPGIPETMTVGPVYRPGLVQAKFGEKVLFESQIQPPLVSNLLTQTAYTGSHDFTYGALMANQMCADDKVKVTNAYTGAAWNWDNQYSAFAYEGEIYLRKGQQLVIYGRFDDGEAAVVDGVTLLAQGGNSGYSAEPAIKGVVYTASATGWYPINAYVWDWSSGKNPMTQPSALSYNLSGLTTLTDQNRDQWNHLEDTDGKGSFLRSKDPTVMMTLGVPTVSGLDVTINAAFANVPSDEKFVSHDAKFVAYVSTSHDGGDDPREWDGFIEIADIQAGETAAKDYTVKGLATYPFVRFAIQLDDANGLEGTCKSFYQMSNVVGFEGDGLAVFVASPSVETKSASFDVVVGDLGTVESLDLLVEVSKNSDFTDPIYSETVATGLTDATKVPVELTGLDHMTTYYIRVKPTADGEPQDWIVANPITTIMKDPVVIPEIQPSGDTTGATDTEAIQRAIDLAADAWPIGTVPLGEGVFHVSAELMVTGGVTLVGRDWSETIIVQESSTRVATVDDGSVVSNLTLTGGMTASGVGGAGAYVKDGSLSWCCVSNNTAGGVGGGVAIEQGSIDHTRIVDNQAKNGGGLGGKNLTGAVTVETCLIAGNTATGNGGGVYVSGAGAAAGASFAVRNSTVAGNTSGAAGGGVYTDFAGTALVNDIIASNSGTGSEIALVGDGTAAAVDAASSNNLTGSGTAAIGENSVSGNPAFAENYHLAVNSPAIGLAAWSEDMPVDLDGRARESWKADAGCFERFSLLIGDVTAEGGSTIALVTVPVIQLGEGATAASVTVSWGESADDLGSSAVAADSAAAGETVTYIIDGLEKNATYYYAVTVTDNALPPETVTTVTNSFSTADFADVIGEYETYPTDPEAVPEGYVVTFNAEDTVNPYYVVPALTYTYPVETTITNGVTGEAEVFYFRNAADFENNASARNVTTDTSYLFLSDAVDAAKSDEELEVIRDNNFVEKTMVISIPLTIDGNGHTVKVPHPFVGEDAFVDLNCTTNVKTVFRVRTGGDVVLRDMTVMGGGEYLPPKADGTEDPGVNDATTAAIIVSDGFNTGDRCHGFLEMENVTVTRSQGALVVGTEAKVRINRCQLVRNCRNCAGGIYNHGTVVMEYSSLSENRSLAPGGGGGGAAENQGVMYVNNCVICNNSSTEAGGAINNYSADQRVKLYLMNSTVSGNFTAWRNGEIKPGGGIGLRAAGPQNAPQGLFYAVNDLVCNNYYYDPATGEVEVNDITLYGNGTTNEIVYCVFGSYNVYEYEHESETNGNHVVDVTDPEVTVFLEERETYRVYANAHMTTNVVYGPMLRSAPDQEFARYAPIYQDGPAASQLGENGALTYFDAFGWKEGVVQMSYLPPNGEMTALGDLEAAGTEDLVTGFYETRIVPNTIERSRGIVGASGWADTDKWYNLILLEKTVNGSVGNISILGDPYKAGTEVTVTATPDPMCSFLGWYDENDTLVSASAAYTVTMNQDIGLKAKFSEPSENFTFWVQCEQTAPNHATFPLVVTTNWLVKAFGDVCPNGIVSNTAHQAQIEALLNAPDAANGLNHVWMNYVLGAMTPGDPNGRLWIRADQTPDPNTLRLRMQQLAPIGDCGFTVRYRLCTKSAEASAFSRGNYVESATFDQEFRPMTAVHHVIDMIFIPAGYAISDEYVTTVNTAGVLKVESSKRAEILASPWAGFSPTNNPAVKAEDYVKAACLSVNDVLYVYDRENANYLAWTVQADGTWKAVNTYLIANGGVTLSEADATRTNAIPRGAGVWLERHDVTKPIYLYGQVDGSSVTTRLESGFNLIGSPLAAPFDLRTIPPPPNMGVRGDHIAIPTGAEPINSYYVDGQGWAVQKSTVTVINEGTAKEMRLVTTEWDTESESLILPVGHGFWYYNKNSATRNLDWKPAAE